MKELLEQHTAELQLKEQLETELRTQLGGLQAEMLLRQTTIAEYESCKGIAEAKVDGLELELTLWQNQMNEVKADATEAQLRVADLEQELLEQPTTPSGMPRPAALDLSTTAGSQVLGTSAIPVQDTDWHTMNVKKAAKRAAMNANRIKNLVERGKHCLEHSRQNSPM